MLEPSQAYHVSSRAFTNINCTLRTAIRMRVNLRKTAEHEQEQEQGYAVQGACKNFLTPQFQEGFPDCYDQMMFMTVQKQKDCLDSQLN